MKNAEILRIIRNYYKQLYGNRLDNLEAAAAAAAKSPMHERKSESEVAQSCPAFSDPWTAAYQAPPSMGFSRQEYCSGVPLLSP